MPSHGYLQELVRTGGNLSAATIPATSVSSLTSIPELKFFWLISSV
jgi:hypothetical protein